MSEQADFEKWFKDKCKYSMAPRDVEDAWNYQQEIIKKQAAELVALREGFIALINVAERCDSWESFPSNALDAAYKVLDETGQPTALLTGNETADGKASA